jgi:endoglucanase
VQIESTGEQVILRGLSLIGLRSQESTNIKVKDVIDYVTNRSDTQGSSPGWYTKMLRLPVDTPIVDADIDGLLKTTVDYATKKGLYAIVDLHFVANPYANDAAVKKFWTKVAPMFKDYSNVFYEPFNESDQTDSWAKYKPTMQAWVDLIRSFAPKNLIFAGSPSWDQTMGDAGTDPLTGENIVYTVHMYKQHYTDGTYQRTQVEKCAAAHPVVMTEWGFNHSPKQPGVGTDLISAYGKPMLTWLEALGGGWTGWCLSDSWGPMMFTKAGAQWTLRVGQDEMGGFVKDWLYTHKDDKSPF